MGILANVTYERACVLKAAIAVLFIAILIYPIDDNDNTACSIFSQQQAGRTFLTRVERSAIATCLLLTHFAHLWVENDIESKLAFAGFAFSVCAQLWVCWDRNLVEKLDVVPQYAALDEALGGTPEHAPLHDIASVCAFVGAAILPATLTRRHHGGCAPRVLGRKTTTLFLSALIVAYLVLYDTNQKNKDKDVDDAERERRLRAVWWLNVFEATIIALSVGMA